MMSFGTALKTRSWSLTNTLRLSKHVFSLLCITEIFSKPIHTAVAATLSLNGRIPYVGGIINREARWKRPSSSSSRVIHQPREK